MKPIFLVLAVVVLSSAQKSHRAGPHGGKREGEASSGAYSETPSHKQYSHGGSHYQQPQQYSGHNGAPAAKATYANILQDNRQINHDGSINFNYAADNGLQQGETVDPDGTRRGYYSYIGADGKPLTVKYTAGKNGFVAEGNHLPRQPSAAAQTKDEVVTKGSGHGHDDGQYQSGPPSGHYQEGPSAGSYYGGAPSHYSANAGSGHEHRHRGHGSHGGPPPSFNSYSGNNGGRSHYSSPSSNFEDFGGFGSGPSFSGHGGGRPSHMSSHNSGHYQSAPQTQYSHSLPSHGAFGGQGQGGRGGSHNMHTAFNPYSPQGAPGPYSGQFDLGNGGHYSINFEPGSAQEVTYGAGSSDGPSGHSQGHSGGHRGGQQRY